MKTVKPHIILFFLYFFMLTGCQSANMSNTRLNKVYLTDTTPVDLLPENEYTKSLSCYNYFQGSFSKNDFAALLYIEINDSGIKGVVLNEMGLEALSFYYDGNTAHTASSIINTKIKCEYVILDIQNIYYDSEVLKKHYKKYNLTLTETPDSRTILKNGKIIETIQYSENEILLNNYLRNYSYRITVSQ